MKEFASQAEKDRILLALDVEIVAELARADFLRQARLERNERIRAAFSAQHHQSKEEPSMHDLTKFYGDSPVRVHIDDEGEPWFVASDVAKILGYRAAPEMTRSLDEDEKGYAEVRTPGGIQKMSIISEAGLYQAIFGSRGRKTSDFKRWVTHEVLPSIRRTGSYSFGRAPASSSSMSGEQLMAAALVEANRVLEEARGQVTEAEERAAAAAQTVRAIEAADGPTLTEFHKHYFSEVGAKAFFEFLYATGLLIDQRGTRGRDARGHVKNGPQHMYPTAKGKEFIYLRASIDSEGVRRERPRVRPGEPEVRLARWLHHRGLRLNEELVGFVEKRELVEA
ncbi:BRO-N domain-containing protein [Actinomyces culturomici]|uniref:BRO-N domain-containing protein n=1 Tax=Actinomyces culturomici TaxID=1926276 RepID=UPI001F1B6F1C|nr:Bro-N domain-containing protein [Actinomyces culturomici]